MNNTTTFEILLGKDKWTTRETKESLLTMLAKRGMKAVKRGYTTWVVYGADKMRCGSIQEIG